MVESYTVTLFRKKNTSVERLAGEHKLFGFMVEPPMPDNGDPRTLDTVAERVDERYVRNPRVHYTEPGVATYGSLLGYGGDTSIIEKAFELFDGVLNPIGGVTVKVVMAAEQDDHESPKTIPQDI